MVPDPLCPRCRSEFVEKIEEENDPRSFVELAGENDGDDDEGHEAHEPLSMEDLLRLIQLISGSPLPREQRQRRQQSQGQPGDFPGDSDDGGFPISFLLDPSGLRSSTGITAVQTRDASTATVSGGEDEDIEMTDATQDQQETNQRPRDPSTSLASLLQRIGFELHLTPDNDRGGGFFNMIGNPGDYVFSQRALDDVITQMMEIQARQSGPVGASEEIINSIPHHTLTTDELEAKIECSVCKDEFTKEDNCLQLKCRHIFHDDCIKPWLKTSGTCPTCRFELVPQDRHGGQDQNQDQDQEQQDGSSSDSSSIMFEF
ncbi:hypothetical protein BGZ54_005411 [Gamsiella multidivaricata]|nr:hypothetical protein BGZ54_005411 [Gamsiella multidivaricata]